MPGVQCAPFSKDMIKNFFANGEFQWKPFEIDFTPSYETGGSETFAKWFNENIKATDTFELSKLEGIFNKDATVVDFLLNYMFPPKEEYDDIDTRDDDKYDYIKKVLPYVSLEKFASQKRLTEDDEFLDVSISSDFRKNFSPIETFRDVLKKAVIVRDKLYDEIVTFSTSFKQSLASAFLGLRDLDAADTRKRVFDTALQWAADTNKQSKIMKFHRIERQLFSNNIILGEEDKYAKIRTLIRDNKFAQTLIVWKKLGLNFDDANVVASLKGLFKGGEPTYISYMITRYFESKKDASAPDPLKPSADNINALLAQKLADLGIDCTAWLKTGTTDKFYYLLLLPKMYSFLWQDYIKEQYLGPVIKQLKMTEARKSIVVVAKNPEKYIDADFSDASYFLQYAKVNYELWNKANGFGDAEKVDLESKSTDPNQAIYKNTKFAEVSQQKDNLPLAGVELNETTKKFPLPLQVSYLELVSGSTDEIKASRKPFWLDSFKKGKNDKNFWFPVITETNNCGTGNLKFEIDKNIIYSVAKMIINGYRDECPKRLSQESVEYEFEEIGQRNLSLLATYATGIEDAEDAGTGKIEYTTENTDVENSSIKEDRDVDPSGKKFVTSSLRVLYFEEIDKPVSSAGYLSFTKIPKSTLKLPDVSSEELPKNVAKSLICLQGTCNVDKFDVARGPLVPGYLPTTEEEVLDFNCDERTARKLADTLGIDQDLDLDQKCDAIRAQLKVKTKRQSKPK